MPDRVAKLDDMIYGKEVPKRDNAHAMSTSTLGSYYQHLSKQTANPSKYRVSTR